MPELFSTAQLVRTGLSHDDIRRQVARGQLVRVRRGHFRREGRLKEHDEHLLKIRAALGDLSDDVVISHASAGVLHSLPVPVAALSRVSVTRIARGHGRIGHDVHVRGTPIDATESVVVKGCAATSLPRTVVDLARTLPFEWAVAAADAALAGGLTRDALHEQLARSHRWPGNRRARSVIAFADPRSESVGESRSRVIFARGGVPTPELQHPIRVNGVVLAWSDFAWEDYGVLGEFDGISKYGDYARPGEAPSDVLVREKAREDRLREQGWLVVRWVWSDLSDPEALCARINHALATGARRRRPV